VDDGERAVDAMQCAQRREDDRVVAAESDDARVRGTVFRELLEPLADGGRLRAVRYDGPREERRVRSLDLVERERVVERARRDIACLWLQPCTHIYYAFTYRSRSRLCQPHTDSAPSRASTRGSHAVCARPHGSRAGRSARRAGT
jgi:hypothetical protein